MSEEETWHKVEAGDDLCLCCCTLGHMGPEFLATIHDIRTINREAIADRIISDHQQAQQVAALIDLLTVARSWTGLGSKGHPFQRLVGFKAVGEWSAKVDKALAAISGKEKT